ncbi:hypothetical protein AQJ23_01000 [Streptomyces antibioticus]|nr:hypothetical protein [Streptomyces antibioticus]KUN29391.1 hypothetical protein AQJ23_01000 [Streptomyces antibioticus]
MRIMISSKSVRLLRAAVWFRPVRLLVDQPGVWCRAVFVVIAQQRRSANKANDPLHVERIVR